MPELPEVENTVCRLRPLLKGRIIRSMALDWPRTAAFPTPELFKRQIRNMRILSLERRGKFIIAKLQGAWLIAHLRMSGSLHVQRKGEPKARWVRAAFDLSGGRRLCFKDARKFGRLWLVDDPAVVLGELGPEPLSAEFTFERFWFRLNGRTGRIKPLLLDQRFIAGIGNIYADESLWRAGIHPCRKADSLSVAEGRRLFRAVREVLRCAIRAQGTDIGDDVVCGDYEPRVYGRKGEACRRCRKRIIRLVVGQRGTYICSRCQSLGRRR